MDTTFEGGIVKSVSIENMLSQREAVMQRIWAALDLLAEASRIADAAHIGFPRFKFQESRHWECIFHPDRIDESKAAITREVDMFAWQHLMDESGLRTFMDAKARGEWNQQIEKGEIPPFTLANVEATFRGLFAARGDMFERGVIAVFRHLSWDYKTNRPFAFGKRIILRGLRGSVSGGDRVRFGYLNHRVTDELDDLVRVFSVLDKKPEPDHRDGMYRLINRADTETPDAGGMDAEYFSLRWFKNGNAHLTFKRPELVDRMNKILAKHYPGALPADRHAEGA